MIKTAQRVLLVLALFALGILPLLLCGCTVRVQVGPADEVKIAREAMEQILKSQCLPTPDETLNPVSPDEPAADSEPTAPTPDLEPLDPVPVAVAPAGWPDGVMIQRFTAGNCTPCKRWDREERDKVAAVMLPDILAWSDSGNPSVEATVAGVDQVPFFQLLKGSTVIWQGRGYFTADLLIERAKQHGAKR